MSAACFSPGATRAVFGYEAGGVVYRYGQDEFGKPYLNYD